MAGGVRHVLVIEDDWETAETTRALPERERL